MSLNLLIKLFPKLQILKSSPGTFEDEENAEKTFSCLQSYEISNLLVSNQKLNQNNCQINFKEINKFPMLQELIYNVYIIIIIIIIIISFFLSSIIMLTSIFILLGTFRSEINLIKL